MTVLNVFIYTYDTIYQGKNVLPTKIQCKTTCFLPFYSATTKTVSKSFFFNFKSHNVLKCTAHTLIFILVITYLLITVVIPPKIEFPSSNSICTSEGK